MAKTNNKQTLADVMLKPYEKDLKVAFQGAYYPAFYLMEKLLRIVNKEGQCIPFHLNRQQIELYIEICKQRREHKPVRINILKSRQIGFSTFIAGLYFIITIFTPNFKAGIVANTVDNAKAIFDKYTFFYEHLDDANPAKEIIDQYAAENKGAKHHLSYKPTLAYAKNQSYIKTAKGNSVLEVIVAGESSGRGRTYNLLHLSECAFFPNLKITMNGLLETVSSKNKDSMIFLETTANGFNEYKERWDKDMAGRTTYKAYFVPWYINPDYASDEKVEKLPRMEQWLEDKFMCLDLTNEQKMWYWQKYLDKEEKSFTLQEYPFCPTDAFLTTGNCIFDAEMVAKQKEKVIKNELPNAIHGRFTYELEFSVDGKIVKMKNTNFAETKYGEIAIYRMPIENHPYIGICDPNNGGGDDSAIQIIDNITLEQVAVFRSNNMALDKVAFQFACLGYMYNTALLSSEMNLGKTVMDYLLKLNYPKIYVRQNEEVDDFTMSIGKKYGHLTTRANRNGMIEDFRISFRENPDTIKDYDTLTQMETFQKIEHLHGTKENTYSTFKIEAASGNHDDLITSYMAVFIVREQQTARLLDKKTENGIVKFSNKYELEEYLEKQREQRKQGNTIANVCGIAF